MKRERRAGKGRAQKKGDTERASKEVEDEQRRRKGRNSGGEQSVITGKGTEKGTQKGKQGKGGCAEGKREET